MTLAKQSTPSLHQQLRSATHHAHVRLNHHPLLRQLTRPALDAQNYTLILQAYWSFYHAAETHIKNCAGTAMTNLNIADRYKTEWLTTDLSRFGLSPGIAGCCPFTIELAAPENEAELIGMMYPLEGSTLGGQVISKHLMRNLGVGSANGGRFFNGYGSKTELLWTQFNQYAERSLETWEARAQACDYANYLFEKLEAFLDVHATGA